ncbi:MFS transporter [Solirhodobacter olei]|uniref:MFS transporter n=1 Tax=Solirhodobacter olei TaxID=2493082 RepID=UPI0019D44DC5|nr:MFS transporter [Solirhodobacter olei]
MIQTDTDQPSRPARLPRAVVALGFVSMLMDFSTEMIQSLLPVYLVSAMGVSMATVGLIEGMAEATAAIVKIFSGALSDWIGRRKVLAVAGYGLAMLVKPLFPLAPTLHWIVGARFLDRVGKGIRGAPRDALVADHTPAAQRGAAYGLRQTLDTTGAFLGPLGAMLFIWLFAGNFRAVFWIACLPAVLCVAVLVLAVDEAPHKPGPRARFPLARAEMVRLGPVFWLITGVACLLTLARFSDAFLVLKARADGLPLALVPLALVGFNIVSALTSYPAGVLSDRLGRIGILVVSLPVLIVADLVLAYTSGYAGLAIGLALWGLHVGLTQGMLATIVADTAPAGLRGTAFGAYNLATGLALFAASALAGALWEVAGPQAAFLAGALAAAVGLAALLAAWRAVPEIGAAPTRDKG